MSKLHKRGGNNPTGIRGDQPPGERKVNINMRCKPEFKDWLTEEATARGVSVTDLIETAALDYLGAHHEFTILISTAKAAGLTPKELYKHLKQSGYQPAALTNVQIQALTAELENRPSYQSYIAAISPAMITQEEPKQR